MIPGDLYLVPVHHPERFRSFLWFSHNLKVPLVGFEGGVNVRSAKKVLGAEEWVEPPETLC